MNMNYTQMCIQNLTVLVCNCKTNC